MIEVDDQTLNQYLVPNTSPLAQTGQFRSPLNEDIESILPIGKVNYSNLDPNSKPFEAIVSLSRTKGAFQNIQEAINFVNKNFPGGGSILIKNGTYTVNANITMYSNISIEGESPQSTVIDFGNNAIQFSVSGTSGVHIKNVIVSKLGFTNGNFDGPTVQLSYADQCVIQDCEFSHSFPNSTNALWHVGISQSQQTSIRRNRFISGNSAILLQTSSRQTVISENYFTALIRDAILDNSFGHVYTVVDRNKFFGVTTGVGYEGPIWFQSGTNIKITGNDFEDCSGTGIILQSADLSTISGNSFAGVVSANLDYAIKINGGSRIVISGNDINGCNTDGIIFTNLASWSTVSGNVSTLNGGYGVTVSAGVVKIVVVGNALVSNTSGGLNDAGTGTVATGNAS